MEHVGHKYDKKLNFLYKPAFFFITANVNPSIACIAINMSLQRNWLLRRFVSSELNNLVDYIEKKTPVDKPQERPVTPVTEVTDPNSSFSIDDVISNCYY